MVWPRWTLDQGLSASGKLLSATILEGAAEGFKVLQLSGSRPLGQQLSQEEEESTHNCWCSRNEEARFQNRLLLYGNGPLDTPVSNPTRLVQKTGQVLCVWGSTTSWQGVYQGLGKKKFPLITRVQEFHESRNSGSGGRSPGARAVRIMGKRNTSSSSTPRTGSGRQSKRSPSPKGKTSSSRTTTKSLEKQHVKVVEARDDDKGIGRTGGGSR